ncbi:MAG: MarR family transcriptional regulator [Lachnospiraceae bacterium]|nr:MarR family transcriptional regulator [Lachnospiraceae bacterium]
MKEYPGRLISILYRKGLSYWGQALKEHEISSAEYPILITLNKKDGITQEEIASQFDMDKSAITRVVRSLLDKGFIEREKDEDDRRCNRIYLTKKGHASKEPILKGMKELSQIATKDVDPDEMEVVSRVLSKMVENICEYSVRQEENNNERGDQDAK